jgi:hypothetical protein
VLCRANDFCALSGSSRHTYLWLGERFSFAPESMAKLSRWFADNPRYLRLAGMLDIGLGIWLAREQHQAQVPPQPWWRRWRK